MAPRRRRRSVDPNQGVLALDFTPAEAHNEAPGSRAIIRSEAPDWVSFSSSRVDLASYDSAQHRLYVSWIKPGKVYAYDGVSSSEWQQFRRSKSPGRFVNRRLNSHVYYPVDL